MLSDATIEVIREALDDASRNARTNIAWYREREARNNGILSMPHIGKLAHYEQVLIANDAALTELDSLAAMPAPDWSYSGPATIDVYGGGLLAIRFEGPFPQGAPTSGKHNVTVTFALTQRPQEGGAA